MDTKHMDSHDAGTTAQTMKPWSTPKLTLYGYMTASTRTTSIPESDRNLKTGFAPVDPRTVLAALSALPIETWSYKSDDPAVRHIGPMAQDFAAAFGVGDDDKHIHVVDSAGVAFAAIQGLNSLVQAQQEEIVLLQQKMTSIQSEVEILRASSALAETDHQSGGR